MKRTRRKLSEEDLLKAQEFKRAGIGRCAVCDGYRRQFSVYNHAHHVIEAQYLRRHHPDFVYDPRNALPVCEDCHSGHTSAMKRIPRSCLRPENEQFAQELGLEHLLDRFYPQGDGS